MDESKLISITLKHAIAIYYDMSDKRFEKSTYTFEQVSSVVNTIVDEISEIAINIWGTEDNLRLALETNLVQFNEELFDKINKTFEISLKDYLEYTNSQSSIDPKTINVNIDHIPLYGILPLQIAYRNYTMFIVNILSILPRDIKSAFSIAIRELLNECIRLKFIVDSELDDIINEAINREILNIYGYKYDRLLIMLDKLTPKIMVSLMDNYNEIINRA